MKFICDVKGAGVRILRCFGYDGQIELPERIHGLDVKELGAYVFADIVRRREAGRKYLAWLREEDSCWEWEECSEELLSREELEDKMPVIKGNELQSAALPKGLKKIGAYAFYHCENLKRLELCSRTTDLGAGLFTGCYGIRELDIQMIPGEKSCLKEVLAELRQTLRVCCRNERGEIAARLIFPEYFEESVENTPARILTLEMHGCGHRYRNAFSGTELQYAVYDKLFPHVRVQESKELVTELALGRLRFPAQLSEERKKIYEEYAAEHGREIVVAALAHEDETMEILRFAGEAGWCSERCMEEMLAEVGRREMPQAAGMLMELRRRKRAEKTEPAGKRKRFVL